MFGADHVLTMLIIFFVSIALPMAMRQAGPANRERLVSAVLAASLVAHGLFKIWVRVFLYGEPLVQHLPLHLCNVATILTAYVLVRRSYSAYEVVYFWGLCGSLPAILTPDLQHGFPSLYYVTYFLSHALVIMGVIYSTLVHGFRPTLRSVAKTVTVALAYMAVVAPLNIALSTNYLYLRHKPEQATVMDYFGPWPWYILALIAASVICCFIFYAPFALLKWLSKRRKSRGTEERFRLDNC